MATDELTDTLNQAPRRWHLVMVNLLYPAILGALIYSFAEELSRGELHVAEPDPWLALLLLILFALDYAHTFGTSDPKIYGPVQFTLDFVIVFCLFFAGRSLLKISPCISWLNHPWLLLAFLALAKAVALIWEDERPGDSKERVLNFKTDAITGVIYGSLLFFAIPDIAHWRWLTLAAMGLDICFYLQHYKPESVERS